MPTSAALAAGAIAPGTLLLEYRIKRVLGTGGFGITYEAQDPHLDKSVAIKEYLPAELAVRSGNNSVSMRSEQTRDAFTWGREQFLKEARVLARFNHPNLIHVYRFFEANNTAYFVMEYAEGSTLDSQLLRDGTMSEAKVRGLLLPILDGLKDVHRARVLHRDIKPSNIITRKDGSPVLIDFGSARQNVGSMTKSIMSVVTTGYAPIEQYAVDGHQGPWTDIYALGAVAYRIVTGKRPIEAVSRLRSDTLTPAAEAGGSQFSPKFLRAIDWALEVQPEDRPVGIAEWRLALEGLRSPPPREVRPPSAPPPQLPLTLQMQPVSFATEDTDKTQLLPSGAAASPFPPVAFPPARAQPASPAPPSEPPPPATGPAADEAEPAPAEPVPRPRAPHWAADRGRQVAGAALFIAGIAVGLLWWRWQGEPPAPTLPAGSMRLSTRLAARKPAPPPPAQPAPAAPAAAAAIALAPAVAVADMPVHALFQDCEQCPVMVVIGAGSFLMGSPPEPGSEPAEQPAHRVSLARSFAIGRHEVTNAQWQACVDAGVCPSVRGDSETGGEQLPVVNVSYADTRAYTLWLSQLSSRHYRLPWESQWEYAARGGATAAFHWNRGTDSQCRHANGADPAGSHLLGAGGALAECSDGHAARAPVASLLANGFGLHDSAGNVSEWVLDCWRDSYVGSGPDGDPYEPTGCARHVVRGGSWRSAPQALRASARAPRADEERSDDLGFRVLAE